MKTYITRDCKFGVELSCQVGRLYCCQIFAIYIRHSFVLSSKVFLLTMAMHEYGLGQERSKDLLRYRRAKRSVEQAVKMIDARTSCSNFSSPPSSLSCCHRNKRPRLRLSVQFLSPEVTAFVPPLIENLTPDLVQAIWYQQAEIASFKATVSRLIVQGKRYEDDELSGLERFNIQRSNYKRQAIRCVTLASRNQRKQQQEALLGQYLFCGSNETWKIGPHSRCSLQHSPGPLFKLRDRRKLSSSRKQDGDEDLSNEFVQKVSEHCTAVSVELALLQAFHDFCEVYDPLKSLLGASDAGLNYNDYFFNRIDGEEGENLFPQKTSNE